MTRPIVAIVLDGHARIHLAATRVPDLLRRLILARAGHPTRVAVALASSELGLRTLVARVDWHPTG
ncbi:hypothetical protein [Methylorubrum aminovorans]